ncbi:MAG: hypothetical protein NVS1B4_16620 [Gemmatimonadaceae bacterium]
MTASHPTTPRLDACRGSRALPRAQAIAEWTFVHAHPPWSAGARRRLRLALLALVSLGFWGCVRRPTPFVPPSALGAPDSLEAVIGAILRTARTPGAAVAVVRNGRLAWSRGYGLADIERSTPVTDSTIFQVASISKSVSAWGVLRLADDGHLDLDLPVDALTSRWHLPASGFAAGQVTVRRVLSHTAGLSNNAYQGYSPDVKLPSLEESLSGRNDGVGDVRIVYPPGTRWAYSEGGFTLLQLIVEEVTQRGFAEYMRRSVLEPLGMTSSSFEWEPRWRRRMATAYDGGPKPIPTYLFTEQAADGLFTTAHDLALFVAAFMNGGLEAPVGRGVLKPATIAVARTPAEATRGTWGLGINVGASAEGGQWVAHAGSNRGWRARMMAYPDRGLGIVVLTNSDNGDAVTDAVVCAWESYELSLREERCR